MATKQQIPKIAATFVEFQGEFSVLSTEDGQWVIQNGKEAVKLAADAIANRAKLVAPPVAPEQPLLGDVVAVYTVPATTKKFVVKDKIKVDTSEKAKVKISYVGENFHSWFGGKIEEPLPGDAVYGRDLNRRSVDKPILAELGGEEKAITTCTEIYAMMVAQPNGETGELKNNGFANIFYVPDINGVLRAVRVFWYGRGWYVEADSVENANPWDADYRVWSRVPSRNSSDAQTC